MRVLIAPDKFKGTLSSPEAGSAIERGIRRALPICVCTSVTVADGGDGTAVALRAHGRAVPSSNAGPGLVLLPDGRRFLEMAEVVSATRDRGVPVLEASTREVGSALARAARSGASIVLGIGGSVSTDGGTGAASVFGWRFLDRRGIHLGPGGGALRTLARIVPPPGALPTVTGACDVMVPLTGPRGAAKAFAPQKGATPDGVDLLEEAMTTLGERIAADLGTDVAARPGAGAGGGMGAGVAAFFGGALEPGSAFVADQIGLRSLIARCDVVVTGEGSLDRQSLWGKAPAGVAEMAAGLGKPCLAVVGRVELGADDLRSAGIDALESLDPRLSPHEAVEQAAFHLFRRWVRP